MRRGGGDVDGGIARFRGDGSCCQGGLFVKVQCAAGGRWHATLVEAWEAWLKSGVEPRRKAKTKDRGAALTTIKTLEAGRSPLLMLGYELSFQKLSIIRIYSLGLCWPSPSINRLEVLSFSVRRNRLLIHDILHYLFSVTISPLINTRVAPSYSYYSSS